MNYIYNPENGELYHYGVKGMKWGVRKKPEYGESIVGRKNPRLSKYERDNGINYGGARRNGSSDLRDASAIGTMAGKALRKGVEKASEKRAQRKNHDDTPNANYTDKQRKHDRAMYGDGAERRINRKMNEGYGIQAARHFEVQRQQRRTDTKRIAKKGAKAAASVLSTIGMAYVSDQMYNNGAGTELVKETIRNMAG